MNYRVSGNSEGSTLVFLHGFLGEMNIWNSFLLPLENAYQIVQIDLPGHGKCAEQYSLLSISHIAVLVNGILDSLDCDKVHVIGHSLGGYVSLELLSQFPEKLKSLTLLNSTALGDTDKKKKERLLAVRVFDMKPELYINDAVKNLFHENSLETHNSVVLGAQLMALKTKPVVAQHYLKAMSERSDHSALVNYTNVPINYIASIQDKTIPFESISAQIVSERINLVKCLNSGHMSFLEEEQFTRRELLNFINSIDEKINIS